MNIEEEKVVSSREKTYSAKDEFRKALKGLKVPESPFRWNPRDGIFAHPRELPPSIDVADMLDAIERTPGLEDVEYPIKTLHWRIMVVIGACYEYVHMKEYVKARRRLKKLVELLREIKRSRERDSHKYHSAFSYIAYALLTRKEDELEVKKIDQLELPAEPVLCNIPNELLLVIYAYAALFFKRYGFKGLEQAEKYLSKVIDSTAKPKSWWYFEKAKILALYRESEAAYLVSVPPTKEEFELTEEALKINIHPFYELHYAKLLGQSRGWDCTQAALQHYIKFGKNYTSSDLLCKCVEGVLDLIRVQKTSERLLDTIVERRKKEAYYKPILDVALKVYKTASCANPTSDLVKRCYGHYHLLNDEEEAGIKYLKDCVTHTYDSIFELIQLEERDWSLELLYLSMLSGQHSIVKSFLTREIIMHYLFALNDLRKAARTAIITLNARPRMADVGTAYIPRLFDIKTSKIRTGIKWADVLESKIKENKLEKEDDCRPFLRLLRTHRQCIYGETDLEVDFDNPNKHVSSAPESSLNEIYFLNIVNELRRRPYRNSPCRKRQCIYGKTHLDWRSLRQDEQKRNKDIVQPDVTGSAYISRKVGALPVIFGSGSQSFRETRQPSVRKTTEKPLKRKKAFVRIVKMVLSSINKPKGEALATISTRGSSIDQRMLDSLNENDSDPEGDMWTEKPSEISQEQPSERAQASGLHPLSKYDVENLDMYRRWSDSEGSSDVTSISSYESSSDDEADNDIMAYYLANSDK